MSGPQGSAGRELLRGAELALERSAAAPELVVLDSFGDRAVANAGRAAADPEALAYLGAFHSADALGTAPLLGDAGLPAAAPAAPLVGVGRAPPAWLSRE